MLDEIKDLQDRTKFDVLFISESKLDSLGYNSLVFHAQYWIVRRDRKKGAGAMLAYIRSTVTAHRRPILELRWR